MIIACAHCNSKYSLSMGEIRGLKHSIYPCGNCGSFIKVAVCPHCDAYYSITFKSAENTRYRLTCQKCSQPFVVEFPRIQEASRRVRSDELPAQRPVSEHKNEKSKKKRERSKDISPSPIQEKGRGNLLKRKLVNRKNKPEAVSEQRPAPRHVQNRTGAGNGAFRQFSIGELFRISRDAISMQKIIISGTGLIIMYLVLFLFNSIGRYSGLLDQSGFARWFINLFPLVLIFFIYIITAAVISRITMEKLLYGRPMTAGALISFSASVAPGVLFGNSLLFLISGGLLFLLGSVPVVAPLIFAFIFLPIYIASIILLLIVGIGFWFYPSIVALRGRKGHIRNLMRFIKKYNFTLIYIIPILMMVSLLSFSVIYLIHYGSFSLSLFMSGILPGDEGAKLFSAIPAPLLQVSDLVFFGSGGGRFTSLFNHLLFTHTIGGIIVGLVFSTISVILFSVFISLTATVSAHFYLLLEKGVEIDDQSKIRILLFLVLMLAGLLLLKKLLSG